MKEDEEQSVQRQVNVGHKELHMKCEWVALSLQGLWRQLGSWHIDGAQRHGAAEEVLEWRRHLFAFPASEQGGKKWLEIQHFTNFPSGVLYIDP